MNTRQAEIASTVHYAAKSLSAELERKPSEQEVFRYVLDWKQRRRPPLDHSAIAQSVRSLAILGWIEVSASSELPLPNEVLLEA